MRTTLALDDELVAKAQALTGVTEKSSLVREALKAFVVGELALGNLRQRPMILNSLSDLPRSASPDTKALQFIEQYSLFGRGIGYINAHLLAGVRLTAGAALWTNDTRLTKVAQRMALAMADSHR
jgi:hypothetical protein